MTLYVYRCPTHGEVEINHPMSEVHTPQQCPQCSAPVRRVLTPLHRFWPSNYRPGFENSSQRQFLDPGRLARESDKLAEMKEEHERREGRNH